MYIVKNKRISQDRNEYFLLDSGKKEYARLEMSPEHASRFAIDNSLKSISPVEAWQR
jgi:hypothetical protein